MEEREVERREDKPEGDQEMEEERPAFGSIKQTTGSNTSPLLEQVRRWGSKAVSDNKDSESYLAGMEIDMADMSKKSETEGIKDVETQEAKDSIPDVSSMKSENDRLAAKLETQKGKRL